jgi:hypothetical protein
LVKFENIIYDLEKNRQKINVGDVVKLNEKIPIVKKSFYNLLSLNGIVTGIKFDLHIEEYSILFENNEYVSYDKGIFEFMLIKVSSRQKVYNSKHLLIEKEIISPIELIKNKKEIFWKYFLMSYYIHYSHLPDNYRGELVKWYAIKYGEQINYSTYVEGSYSTNVYEKI